jgi:hypothetical protein
LWPSFHGVADAIHASFTCSVHFAFTASNSRIPIGVLARSQIPCSTNASPVAPPQRCCLWPVPRPHALDQEFAYLRRSRGARWRREQPGERRARPVESGPIERRRRQEVGSTRDRRAVLREAGPWLPLDVLIPGALQNGSSPRNGTPVVRPVRKARASRGTQFGCRRSPFNIPLIGGGLCRSARCSPT